MRNNLTRRRAMETLLALGLGTAAGVDSVAAGHGEDDHHPEGQPLLNRLATTTAGAEFTGIELTEDGQLFFNVQHPAEEADEDFRPGAVGAVANVDMTALPRDFGSVQPPEGDATHVRTAHGDYQVIAEGGDETMNGRQLGVPYDANGEPMTDAANPDFNGFVPIDDSANEGYLFTNWETQPGMVSRMHIKQYRPRGYWHVLEKRNLDFRPVEGTWNNCFGTVAPWGNPLTSEEYEPDAEAWFDPEQTGYNNPEESFRQYLDGPGNPYRYGYIVEIEEPTSDEPTPVKHYAMGRFSHENSFVMPDERTVYMSDDGTGTVFFKFIADEAGDLSAGTLYAARASQDGDSDPAEVAFDIEWVELGHATDDEVEAWISEYDGQPESADATYITDEDVEAWANGEAEDDRVPFLEARKAAGAMGATDEFRKMEGVKAKREAQPGDYLYMAMSEVNRTMLSNEDAEEDNADTEDHVQVEGNEYGAVYRLQLRDDYDVDRMEPVIVGGPDANICGGCPYDADPNSASSVCQGCSFNPANDGKSEDSGGKSQAESSVTGMSMQSRGLNRVSNTVRSLAGKGMASLTDVSQTVDPENTVANPDNLIVMPDDRVIVGEDSHLHEPNMLWLYDPAPGVRRGQRGGKNRGGGQRN